MTQSFPLHWPLHKPRTQKRNTSQFWTTMGKSIATIKAEIERLGGSNLIISTNIPVRRDGLPYANPGCIDDPGVAVYFDYHDQQFCFANDKYDKIECNLQGIAKTIEALRGIARWGTGDMMQAAFTGFQALPAPGQTPKRRWQDVLQATDLPTAERHFRNLARTHHPDFGGLPEVMAELNQAIADARAEARAA